jgi:hypothetical protein
LGVLVSGNTLQAGPRWSRPQSYADRECATTETTREIQREQEGDRLGKLRSNTVLGVMNHTILKLREGTLAEGDGSRFHSVSGDFGMLEKCETGIGDNAARLTLAHGCISRYAVSSPRTPCYDPEHHCDHRTFDCFGELQGAQPLWLDFE